MSLGYSSDLLRVLKFPMSTRFNQINRPLSKQDLHMYTDWYWLQIEHVSDCVRCYLWAVEYRSGGGGRVPGNTDSYSSILLDPSLPELYKKIDCDFGVLVCGERWEGRVEGACGTEKKMAVVCVHFIAARHVCTYALCWEVMSGVSYKNVSQTIVVCWEVNVRICYW